MAQGRKPIWLVKFKYNRATSEERVERVAAYDILEVLSYYTQEGQKEIIQAIKLDEEISYMTD